MSFACKSSDLCHLGWLFYILSELIPVTLFFLVVIYFNISFASGPLNGVIFFMQVIDALKIHAEDFIQFDETVECFSKIHKFVYRMFSLNMFALEELSFCLWPGRTSALDMLVFRYVTIIYSLLLILATVFLIKLCRRSRSRLLNLKHSIIHGLTTFLVMSYSECTRVSLMIITGGRMTVGYNSSYMVRAFYNAEFSYLGREHLPYALPAFFFITTLVAIPPILLFAYPLCYKLFALLRIEESKFIQITCKIFFLEKIKPLFDSMQFAFKDDCRFFAGLYFWYRLCLVVTFAYSSLSLFYAVTGVQLAIILGMHGAFRPYKTAWHNFLDAALFSNLAIINAITFYSFNLATEHVPHARTMFYHASGIQQGLVLLPLVYLVLYTLYGIVMRMKQHCIRAEQERTADEDNTNHIIDAMDSRSFDDSLIEKDMDYMLLEDITK